MTATPDQRVGPLVFAHRGSSAALPEHTLGAYLRAIDEGADGLECDVRLTRDGHLVCLHDRRLGRTSDGSGAISRLTLAELDQHDFGSWHPGSEESADALILDRTRPGEPRARVLTLDRLLDAARAAGRPLRLLIETKHPTRYGGDVEMGLIRTLREHGLHEPGQRNVHVTVMSFSALAIRRVRDVAPRIDTVWLTEFVTPGLRSGRLPFGAKIAGPSIRAVRAAPAIVARLHATGHRVYVWTVNKPEDFDLTMRLGVDGIISDRPRYILDRLGR